MELITAVQLPRPKLFTCGKNHHGPSTKRMAFPAKRIYDCALACCETVTQKVCSILITRNGMYMCAHYEANMHESRGGCASFTRAEWICMGAIKSCVSTRHDGPHMRLDRALSSMMCCQRHCTMHKEASRVDVRVRPTMRCACAPQEKHLCPSGVAQVLVVAPIWRAADGKHILFRECED